MLDTLKIMYLNIGKRKQVQHSLLNDEGIQDFSLILSTEPHIYRHPTSHQPTVSPHRHWQMFCPTTHRADGTPHYAFRSIIWAHQDCKATAIPVDSYDITAVTIQLQEKVLLAVACYDPHDAGTNQEKEEQLAQRLALLQHTIHHVQESYPTQTVEVLIGADLNRHNVL